MEKIAQEKLIEAVKEAEKITFLTGAGVSTPSGIPDYRSLGGVYHGIDQPEYLLSDQALYNEPEKFYDFIKNLYHPDAKPNAIHQAIAGLDETKEVWVISQNIDHLHRKAGSRHVVDFHGNLYDCYCRKCGEQVTWQEYLESDRHTVCGGQLRPNVVLYGEGLDQENIRQALSAVEQADLIMVVGTTFQVHPFCDLLGTTPPKGKVMAVNQTPVHHPFIEYFYQGDALPVFEKIKQEILA